MIVKEVVFNDNKIIQVIILWITISFISIIKHYTEAVLP